MGPTTIKQLSVLAVLMIFLCIKICLRHREALIKWFKNLPDSIDEWRRSREFRKHWRPSFLNASSFSQRIEQVRRDPRSVVGSHRRHPASHQRVMEKARKSIVGSSYIRRLEKDAAVSEEGEAKRN